VWLVFELSLFRDSSFAAPWLYILVMVAIGAVYLVGLLIKRGGPSSLAMPGMRSIDAELESELPAEPESDPEGARGKDPK